jgi:hypothetical protein
MARRLAGLLTPAYRPRAGLLARCLLPGAVVFGLAAELQAQAGSPSSSQRADSLVAAAEAAGAAHPRAARLRQLPASWDASAWWGSSDRKCVAARGRGPIRSGDFIIGGALGDQPAILPRVPAKIWWAPLHNSEHMDSLVVVGQRLSPPMQIRLSFGLVAFPVTPQARAEPGAREYFYPSRTVIPDWGQWLLVASSGPNWGCFIVTLGRGQDPDITIR